jgi:hypothetical protein
MGAGGGQTGHAPENRPGASFPRKRESIFPWDDAAPRFRGGDSRLRFRPQVSIFLPIRCRECALCSDYSMKAQTRGAKMRE